jgi:CTP synthase (UTP-ammonia lyase)
MNLPLKVGIVGDYDPKSRFHVATNEALGHAAHSVSASVDFSWLPTPSLEDQSVGTSLGRFDAIWCAPGSPYRSMDGALRAVRFAREMGWPFIGT